MSNRTCRGAFSVAAVAFIAALVLAPGLASAQTPYIPYFGKNQIRYDNFKWNIYTTEHFEIYYYPEIEQHLERVAGYAESAYQHVSAELKYDLAYKVPLILFKTNSEFQQQNVIPGAAQEGVQAFAEPTRYRIVMPIDEPPDLLYRTIVHELTHQFEFDIIPTSLIRRSVPLWVNEGLSDYMTGMWRPIDLMTVRDAAVSDIVPKMTEMEGYAAVGNVRMVYNLGHAVFEFIESRWGKEGIRQYLFSLRKSVIGGGEDAYMEAFKLTPEDFDLEFDKYLKDRFKPFRDKERPADYGRNLAPNPERSSFIGSYSNRALALRRSDRHGHRQPPRPGDGHRTDVIEGRFDHPQPDQRVRPGSRVRVHHHARHAVQHGALALVVAVRGRDRILRPCREVAHAGPSERAQRRHR